MSERERLREEELDVVSRLEFERLSNNVSTIKDDLNDVKEDLGKVKEDVDRLETSHTRIETKLSYIEATANRTESNVTKLVESSTFSKVTLLWTSAGLLGGAILMKVLAFVL